MGNEPYLPSISYLLEARTREREREKEREQRAGIAAIAGVNKQ